MAIAAEALTWVLVFILLGATAFAMLVGILGGVFGEGFARCSRCRRLTLSSEGQAHPDGCPATLREHIVHVSAVALHGVHVRHHG